MNTCTHLQCDRLEFDRRLCSIHFQRLTGITLWMEQTPPSPHIPAGWRRTA